MRITGGTAKGQVISGPARLEARPTLAKTRQAFFNILRDILPDAYFLDLFAGVGLMGIEALSRGASCLIAVEENKRLAKGIEANLARLGFSGEVICADVRKALPVLAGNQFDIIYADPPYASGFYQVVLEMINEYQLLKHSGVLVFEHLKRMPLPDKEGKLIAFDRRGYGQTCLTFYRLV